MTTLTLLIVEDDIVDRAAVARALKAARISATIFDAGDADAALDILAKEPIDCVLLDYRLPRTDGLEFLKRARAIGMTTPVIALTGHGDQQLAVELMRAGAADYLVKQSLTPDRLERSLRHALTMAQADRERRDLLAREKAAREEAQAANRAKDDFLATLSHELRTPLNAILGWAHLLSSGALDEQKKIRAVETIERNAMVQLKLIEDLLDISRVIAGKMHLEQATVEVGALVGSVVESSRLSAVAKSIHLTCESAGPDCLVRGDAHRLQQVVGNLLSNALKFTPAGGQVAVEHGVVDGRAVISVRDTGVGLDPEFLPQAFDRFRQADNGPTRPHGGLGLGLAIVRHLVELHGGDVSAFSDGPGRGARFAISLPILMVGERPGVVDRPPVSDATRFDNLHILAVDDDQESLMLLETMLTQHGARVTAVSSARAALEEMQRCTPDLLMSDIAMPAEDGFSLIQAVRAMSSDALNSMPAVAVTAYAGAQDRAKAMMGGFQAHLTKPVDPKELAAVVAALATRRHDAIRRGASHVSRFPPTSTPLKREPRLK